MPKTVAVGYDPFSLQAVDYDPFADDQVGVAAGQVLGNALDSVRGPGLKDYYDPKRSFAENALDPRAIEQAGNIAMGFSGGGLGIRAYHGSPADFEAFDLGKAGTTTDEGMLGRALYFGTDPRVAEGSPHRYEVDLNVANPFKVEATDWGFPKEKRAFVTKALGIDPNSTAQQISDALKAKGHDSVSLDYSPLGYKHQEIAVLDPSMIEIVRKYGIGALIASGALPAKQYLIPVDHDPFGDTPQQ